MNMDQRGCLESFFPSSKINNLMSALTKMSKNLTIETPLSQVLDDFLERLGECDSYLENGIINMNFAEAALLLQNSANVYSKKVDLLWDMIFDYQKRLLVIEDSAGDKDQEIEKVEERKRKYRRKRKTNADEKQNATLVNAFSFGNEDCDYLQQTHEPVDLTEAWLKTTSGCSQTSNLKDSFANKNFSFLPEDLIYTQDKDYLGKYNQFHSTSLIEDIFHLKDKKLLSDDYNCVTNMRIDLDVINDFYLEKGVPANKREIHADELRKHIDDYFEANRLKEKELKDSFVLLERLPVSVVQDRLRRESLADSLFDDDRPNLWHSIENDTSTGRLDESFDRSQDKRSKSASQDSAFFEEDVDEEVAMVTSGVTAETVVEATVAVATTDVVDNVAASPTVDEVTELVETSECAESRSTEQDTTLCVTSKLIEKDDVGSCARKSERKRIASKKLDYDNFLMCPLSCVHAGLECPLQKTQGVKRNLESREEDDDNREVVKRRRVSAKTLMKLAKGMTVRRHAFEDFFRQQYIAEDGEGIVRQELSDSDESDPEPDDLPDTESEPEDLEPEPPSIDSDQENDETEAQDEEAVEQDEQNQDAASVILDDHNYCVTPSLPDLSMPSCSRLDRIDNGTEMSTSFCRPLSEARLLAPDSEIEQEEISRKKVREWRNFILPKLKTIENKTDFDIHAYGSTIMEPSQIGEERYFKDIVKGKSASEVTRLFVAALQLANTSNVELIVGKSGQLANDSFKVKVVDKTRHHELLDDYQAPSEESFRERLERAKAMNPNTVLHSTPNLPPPAKRFKFSKKNAKKLF